VSTQSAESIFPIAAGAPGPPVATQFASSSFTFPAPVPDAEAGLFVIPLPRRGLGGRQGRDGLVGVQSAHGRLALIVGWVLNNNDRSNVNLIHTFKKTNKQTLFLSLTCPVFEMSFDTENYMKSIRHLTMKPTPKTRI
jgi:hypothetical protein